MLNAAPTTAPAITSGLRPVTSTSFIGSLAHKRYGRYPAGIVAVLISCDVT
jgi:hypothetical protein